MHQGAQLHTQTHGRVFVIPVPRSSRLPPPHPTLIIIDACGRRGYSKCLHPLISPSTPGNQTTDILNTRHHVGSNWWLLLCCRSCFPPKKHESRISSKAPKLFLYSPDLLSLCGVFFPRLHLTSLSLASRLELLHECDGGNCPAGMTFDRREPEDFNRAHPFRISGKWMRVNNLVCSCQIAKLHLETF